MLLSNEDGVQPIKWHSKISNDIHDSEINLKQIIKQIEKINGSNKSYLFQSINNKIEDIKSIINKLKSEKDNKIKIKESIQHKKKQIGRNVVDVTNKLEFTDKRIKELSVNRMELSDRILKIQSYLNQLQFMFINEILTIFPITLNKYDKDRICDLPIHIDLSDSSVLESNDSTASAIILLTILATSISFILDICYSSMDIKKFAFQTIGQQSTPLKRDEIMCIYRFLVKTVHHITQSTLFRDDIDKKKLMKFMPIDSLTKFSSTDLSAENYPLKKLVMFRDNLNQALFMNNISNSYVLQLPQMFNNYYISDFSTCSKITIPITEEDFMDFEELSSILPIEELPSVYLAPVTNYNPMKSDLLSWFKK